MSTRYPFMQIVPSPHVLIEKQRIEAPLKEAEAAFPLLVLDGGGFHGSKNHFSMRFCFPVSA
jgi:hypothetical protein